jgi:hypothetical protein
VYSIKSIILDIAYEAEYSALEAVLVLPLAIILHTNTALLSNRTAWHMLDNKDNKDRKDNKDNKDNKDPEDSYGQYTYTMMSDVDSFKLQRLKFGP